MMANLYLRGETIPDALSVEEYGRLYNAYREGSECSKSYIRASKWAAQG